MKRPILFVIWFVILIGKSFNETTQTSAFTSCQDQAGEIIYITDGGYFSMNPDGSNIEALPHGDLIDFKPVWSPDGSQIAFGSINSGPEPDSIYIMDADGNNLQKLVDIPLDLGGLAWSPTGKQLAFSAISEGLQVFVVDIDGQNLQQLTFGREYYHLVGEWSPDGTRLIISNLHETTRYYLSIIDLESGETNDLTSPEDGVYDYFVGWMPDGESVLFNSNRISDDLQLLSININSGELKIVVSDFAASGVWAPDGTQLGYVSIQNTDRPNNNIVNIVIWNAQTEKVTQVISDEDRLDHENYPTLTWSPDSTQLAFESFVEDEYEIFKINVDGSNMTQLTFDGGTNPIWRPCP